MRDLESMSGARQGGGWPLTMSFVRARGLSKPTARQPRADYSRMVVFISGTYTPRLVLVQICSRCTLYAAIRLISTMLHEIYE